MAGFDNTQGSCQTADNAVGWAAANANFDTFLVRTAAGTLQIQKFDGTAGSLNSVGVLKLSNGTAGAPALAFSNSGAFDTGLFSTGANVAIAAGGVLKAFSDTNGITINVSGTSDLRWSADGGGNIGQATNNRPASIWATSSILAAGTGGVGYNTGAGGTITQLTSRTTGVTLNKTTGQITMFAAAPVVGTPVSFTVTNTTVAATDVIVLSVATSNAANTYEAIVSAVASGSFQITMTSLAGTTSDSPVINFAVVKGVAA